MNKQNEFYQNQVSTGIQDSWQKSTYSSRYYRSHQKKLLNSNKKHLPSRYEKAVIMIQRYWRFRQAMKRRICEAILNQISVLNECYDLENRVLEKLVSQYESIVSYHSFIKQSSIKESIQEYQCIISQSKKQCVVTSFKLQKKRPKKQLLCQLINKKQQQKQLNLLLNRQKLIVEQQLQQEKRQYDMLVEEYKRLNMQRLQLTKQKNELGQRNAERLLKTSKFGSKRESKSG